MPLVRLDKVSLSYGLEAEQAAVQAALGEPKLFRDSPAEAHAALERLQLLAQELESAYARWRELESIAG